MSRYSNGYEMLIRVFVEATTERATELAHKLMAMFEPDVLRWDIEDYSWKFEGQHIISFFVPICETLNGDIFNKNLDEISQKLANGGWKFCYAEQDSVGEATWNPVPEAQFVIEEAVFAHLDVCQPKWMSDEWMKDFVPEELD